MSGASIDKKIRSICLGLPEVTERLSHGTPAFFVGKQFAMLWLGGHHDANKSQLWCAAPPGAQADMMERRPTRYFRPPYVGHRGWVGVWLVEPLDLDELALVLTDAYRCVAPRRLLAVLED